MSRTSSNIKRCLSFALLAIFVYNFAANNLFLHTHTTPNGVVTHSHPFIPSNHHTHSSIAIGAIGAINASTIVLDNAAIMLAVLIASQWLFADYFAPQARIYTSHSKGRAPPQTA